MFTLSCIMLTVLFICFYLFTLSIHSPLLLVLSFAFFVCWSTLSVYMFINDFMPYAIFLVYIGGLLVLLIYMVMMSTNTLIFSPHPVFLAFISFSSLVVTWLLYWNMYFNKALVTLKSMCSWGSMVFSYSGLVTMVAVLLYIFLYLCDSLRLGGRTLKVS